MWGKTKKAISKTIERQKYFILSQLLTSVKVFRSFLLKKPFAVSFDLTNRCNLHCPMCYWRTDRKKEKLTNEEMKVLAKKIRKKDILQATWVGTEPLLRTKLLKELVKLSYKY